MSFLADFTQGRDDITKDKETLVDVDAFLEGRTLCSCLLDSFTTCQIDEVKFGHHEFTGARCLGPAVSDLLVLAVALIDILIQIIDLVLLDGDGENGMRSGGVVVHEGRRCGSGIAATVQAARQLLVVVDFLFVQAVNCDGPVLFFTNVDLAVALSSGQRLVQALWIQQIMELFVIDFEETAFDDEF